MWSKISQALKSRTDTDPSSISNSEIMSKVYEQHPNLSVFHTAGEIPFPSPSPPDSPSKQSRRGMFQRLSKMPMAKVNDDQSSPVRYAFGISKKTRPPLNLDSNGSHVLSRASSDALRDPSDASRDTTRSLNSVLRRASLDLLRRPSHDILGTPAPPITDTANSPAPWTPFDKSHPLEDFHTPITPLDIKAGSVRSILRDPNAPGTGQNVRFFSRDAYKVISPDVSVTTDADMDRSEKNAGFMESLQPASSTPAARIRPSVTELFSGPDEFKESEKTENKSLASFMPLVQPQRSDISGFFDMSQDHELPTIPLGLDVPLLDTAIEVSAADDGSSASNPGNPLSNASATNVTSTPYRPKCSEPSPSEKHSRTLDRSQSFNFGQTVFYSVADSSSVVSNKPISPADIKKAKSMRSSPSPPNRTRTKNHDRALSDTVFQNMIREPNNHEADINDESSSNLAMHSTSTPEPDPFNANATTYYTPQMMIHTTPPQSKSNHARKTSREEDIIFTLRTQLALQSELCTQYEVDLRARDELVEVLGKRVEHAEREGEKRRNVLKGWKKKVAELERVCRHLEDEVDQSRQENVERSVMDEASGEALMMLHRQIATLDGEKMEAEKREESLREEVGTLERLLKERTDDVQRLNEVLWTRDESEKVLKNGIKDAKEQMELMGLAGELGDSTALSSEPERIAENQQGRHITARLNSDEERPQLEALVLELQREKAGSDARLNDIYQQLKFREDEFGILKNELEAQWRYTEETNEKIRRLESERDELRQERDRLQVGQKPLEDRINDLEAEWTAGENKRNELKGEIDELWSIRGTLENERDELDQLVRSEREQLENLKCMLRQCEDRAEALDQERQFAIDHVSRLQDNVRQRDAELADFTQQIVQREAEAEQLREQMSKMRREHARAIDEQVRALEVATGQESEAKHQMEVLVRAKAESDVENTTLKERANALKDEVERLRRQVQTLQQESADKEVKIVQLTKQRGQDKEDLHGLNIALDSKQQELELVKRRLGVKGTAGSTPAQTSKIAHRRDPSTPGLSRPPSTTLEMGSVRDRQLTETPSVPGKTSALTKSARINAAGNGSSVGSMGPPVLVKPRVSSFNTPSQVPALSRSSSTKTMLPSTPVLHRRVSSTMNQQSRMKISRQGVSSGPVSEVDEKENVDLNAKAAKKRTMLPMPA